LSVEVKKKSLELWIQNVYCSLKLYNPWRINDHSIVKFKFDCRIGKRLIDLDPLTLNIPENVSVLPKGAS